MTEPHALDPSGHFSRDTVNCQTAGLTVVMADWKNVMLKNIQAIFDSSISFRTIKTTDERGKQVLDARWTSEKSSNVQLAQRGAHSVHQLVRHFQSLSRCGR